MIMQLLGLRWNSGSFMKHTETLLFPILVLKIEFNVMSGECPELKMTVHCSVCSGHLEKYKFNTFFFLVLLCFFYFVQIPRWFIHALQFDLNKFIKKCKQQSLSKLKVSLNLNFCNIAFIAHILMFRIALLPCILVITMRYCIAMQFSTSSSLSFITIIMNAVLWWFFIYMVIHHNYLAHFRDSCYVCRRLTGSWLYCLH